jgi:hypothetical protein
MNIFLMYVKIFIKKKFIIRGLKNAEAKELVIGLKKLKYLNILTINLE